ncbi:GOLPH3/VPS74 family protein [Salimicrobium halophilum]|uniref:Golgi phosphoprotein 3 (GPP34) n=1 Tax=Salimicrobium halophilum TaxID=86666 RepID=A0A1G8T410_9BACI|nr:GPP34 family phosphoprotein [Salimicrobium halophilum]SDJ36213.1 Golgi phosphoprotein 3 (GPP34) [Salimicrobium halophilum]
MFTIAEELLLLALHDKKGTVVARANSSLDFGLAGAFIGELALRERVKADGKKLVVTDTTPVDDPYLNEIFEEIKNFGKELKIKGWVEKFGYRMKKKKKGMMTRLAERGVLEEKEKEILFVFKRKKYPSKDASYEQEIRTKLNEAFESTEPPEPRTLILLSLIDACDLVKQVFPKEEAKQKKKQIRKWAKRNPYGKAVNQAIQATNASVFAAVGAAAAASATSGSS